MRFLVNVLAFTKFNFQSQKFPEKFYFEGLQEVSGQTNQHSYLPVYFSNVCLRFLPVLGILCFYGL
jgi:hypothetical protein